MKIVLLLAASMAFLHAQGSLSPPGAPGPTMKTLAQIEARTPIESLPYTISQSGSYYFTGNLQFKDETGNAITITSENVTLDLNGFTLSSTAGVTGGAIHVGDGLNNISIKNGHIAGNTTVTITGDLTSRVWTSSASGFNHGIYSYSSKPRNIDIDQLGVSGCRLSGIIVNYASVTKSTASSNGSVGIDTGNGSVTSSVATYNGFIGIRAQNGTVTGSIASSNGYDGFDVTFGAIANSTATSNGSLGIDAYSASVTNSTAKFNGTHGISAIFGSVFASNASGNATHGVIANSGTVANCNAGDNGWSGVVASDSSVTNCTARSNNTAGSGYLDLYATSSVVAFCRYGTGNTTGSTLTGNKTP